MIDTITRQVFAESKTKKKLQLLRHKFWRDSQGSELILTASKQKCLELCNSYRILFRVFENLPPNEKVHLQQLNQHWYGIHLANVLNCRETE